MLSLKWMNSKNGKELPVVGGVLLIFIALIYAQMTAASTYTWDNGGGDGLWSTCTNWSSDVCPGSGDIATFDGSTTDDSVIDGAFAGNVRGVDINSGYTGTITQQRNLTIGSNGFAQDDGVYSQGATTFNINNGGFTLSSGSFTTATGTSYVERNFTVSGSATFTGSSSKVWIFDGSSSDNTTFTYPGVFPGIVDISKSYYLSSFTLVSGTTLNNFNDSSSHVGPVTINSGAVMNLGNNALGGNSLDIQGTLRASSTINLSGDFTLGASAVFVFDGTNIYVERNYTDSGGTFDETGIIFTFDGSSSDNTTFTYPGVFPGIVDISKSYYLSSFTLVSGTTLNNFNDSSSHVGPVTINSGAVMNLGNNALGGNSLDIQGTLRASSTINLSGDFTLGASAVFVFDGTNIYVQKNYTDNGGTFDESGVTFTFDGASGYTTTFTYTGVFPGTVVVAKTYYQSDFILSAAATVNMATTSTVGEIRVYGALKTDGNSLTTGQTFTVYDGGTLALYAGQTITTPTLNTGSTVEYYGPGTYTSIGDYAYQNLKFSSGTYNLISDISVAGDFINSGATFNQTAGTTTFTGLSNTISGSNTFANLSKIATTSSSLIFPASETQTITGALTLYGSSSSQRLSLEPFGQGQWGIDPQGTRDVNYLEIALGNNINSVLWNCYDVDCTDGGNNTNIYFTEPLPTYRLRGGVRLHGGVRL